MFIARKRQPQLTPSGVIWSYTVRTKHFSGVPRGMALGSINIALRWSTRTPKCLPHDLSYLRGSRISNEFQKRLRRSDVPFRDIQHSTSPVENYRRRVALDLHLLGEVLSLPSVFGVHLDEDLLPAKPRDCRVRIDGLIHPLTPSAPLRVDVDYD